MIKVYEAEIGYNTSDDVLLFLLFIVLFSRRLLRWSYSQDWTTLLEGVGNWRIQEPLTLFKGCC